jgi:surface antigen
MPAKLIHIVVSASLISSAGCATKSGTGTAVGAGAGGIIGGLAGGTTGALIGVVAGGLLGYGVGRAMEEEDKRRMALALEQDRPAYWTNPQTGDSYRVEPTQTFYQGTRECRNFRMLATVDGTPDEVNGLACRNPNGAWEVQSS